MIAIISSKTSALKLQKSLQRQGVASEIIQTPERLKTAGGCSFALKFDKRNMTDVKNAAKQSGVIIIAIRNEGL